MANQQGNMYEFITKTWNPLGGKCEFNCSYCSTNGFRTRFKIMREKYSGEPRIIESEMNKKFSEKDAVFVVAQNDLFAQSVPNGAIGRVLRQCNKYPANYIFQTKHPIRFLRFLQLTENINIRQITPCIPVGSTIITTIETNREYENISNNCPTPKQRASAMAVINGKRFKKQITIEPIMDFDLDEFVNLILTADVEQVNIGSNTCKQVHLPEPSKEKIQQLITELEKFTKVYIKSNLKI